MRKKLILLASGILIKCLNLLFVLLLLINRSSTALQYNVTIDDQTGDPTNSNLIQYSPENEWIIGQTCTDCDLSPTLRSNAYLGTWMNATYETDGEFAGHEKQASVTFEGIAVYVVCITINTNETDDGTNDITFAIDGLTNDNFEKVPVSSSVTTFDFNQTVFAMTGLSNTSHTLLIQAGHLNQKAVILLDAIIYTKDDGSVPQPSASSQTVSTGNSNGASGTSPENQPENTVNQTPVGHDTSHAVSKTRIIAGGIGAASALCGVGVIIFYLRRRHRLLWRKGISPLIIVGTKSQANQNDASYSAGSGTVHPRRGTGRDPNVPDTDAATRASSVTEIEKHPVRPSSPWNRPLSPISEAPTVAGGSSSQAGTSDAFLPPYEQINLGHDRVSIYVAPNQP